jgi:hypothetical protein
VSPDKRRGPSSPKLDPHPDATEAAKPLNVSSQHTGGCDRNRRLPPPLLADVTHGRDRTPLDGLTTAAGHGRDLIDAGADRVAVVTALVLAAEAVGAPRNRAEDVVRAALRGAA